MGEERRKAEKSRNRDTGDERDVLFFQIKGLSISANKGCVR
jgi:hypothetical protein